MKTKLTNAIWKLLAPLGLSFALGLGHSAHAQGTISGSVTLVEDTLSTAYPLRVAVYDDPSLTVLSTPNSSGEPSDTVGQSFPNASPYAYTLPTAGDQFADGTYYVVAFIDWNGNGLYDIGTDLVSTATQVVNIAGADVLAVDHQIDVGGVFFNDTDSDGLIDLEEMLLNTNPGVADTDDDSISDLDEVVIGTDPVDDLSPFVLRYLSNDGSGRVEVPADVTDYDTDGQRFNLENWTIESMVMLEAAPVSNVILIQRTANAESNPLKAAQPRISYELGIRALDRLPYVRIQNLSGTSYEVIGVKPVPLNEWMVLGGRWSRNGTLNQGVLSLFQDGSMVRERVLNTILPSGIRGRQIGPLVLAENLIGRIDEVRIWNRGIPDSWVESNAFKTLLFGRDSIFMGSLAPYNGSFEVPNHVNYQIGAAPFSLQSWVFGAETGTIVERVAPMAPTSFGATQYNYRIRIEGGQVAAYVTALYDVLTRPPAAPTPPSIDQRWATHRIAGGDVSDGQWHHVALSLSPTNALELVLDGELVASRNIGSATAATWHLDTSESEVAVSSGTLVQLANGAGSVSMGQGFTNNLVDQVGLFSSYYSPVVIQANYITNGLAPDLMSFTFDFYSPDQPIRDLANPSNSGSLNNEAFISLESGANAPIISDNRIMLASVMAGYFSMNDGGTTVQDEIAPRSVINYSASAGVLVSAPNIDFTPVTQSSFSTDPLAFPVFFPLPADSPYRMDADGDGMPDIFEVYFGMAANDVLPPLNPEQGPWGDLDGDGLPNVYEYWAGTDPRTPFSRNDSISDSNFDSDGDGISNRNEYLLGSHPGRTDTDDDGISDSDEINPLVHLRRNNPSNSMDPLVVGSLNPVLSPKSLRLEPGADRFRIPRPNFDRKRFNTDSWTLETWFRPADVGPQTGALVEYVGENWEWDTVNPPTMTPLVFYRLGVDANRPYVEMQTAGNTTVHRLWNNTIALDPGAWSHLAATFDQATGNLTLYVNSLQLIQLQLNGDAMSGGDTVDRIPGHAYIGQTGLVGHVKDVRIWDHARSQAMITQGMEHLVQLNEPGMIANFRFDDGRQGALNNPAADGDGANDARGAEDFSNRVSLTDLESAWAYSITGVIFDPTVLPPYAGFEFDDQNMDSLPDWWEDMYYTALVEFYDTTRNATGIVVPSASRVERVLSSDDFSNAASRLGWSIDYSPLESVADQRLWETPDVAFYFKSFVLSSLPAAAELRLGWRGGVEVYVNGTLLDLTGLPASPNTFQIPGGGTVPSTAFIADAVIRPLLRVGHNKIAVRLSNTNGNSPDEIEFFEAQLLADSTYFIRQSNDPAATREDLRWWVWGLKGSLATPPADFMGRLWQQNGYGNALLEDLDGEGLNNYFEFLADTNPAAMDSDLDTILDQFADSDGDGLGNLEEQILGSHPGLIDTDDDGLQDGDASESLATDSRFPAKDFVLSLDGSGHVLAPNQSRFTLDQFTLMAWVNPNAVGGELITRQLRTGTLNYSIRQLLGGQVEFRFTAGDGSGDVVLTTAQILPVNQWTHVAVSFDKATGMRQIFFNGTQVAAQTTVKRPGFMGFGATQTVIGRGLSGEMDEVGFFNRPLSVDEIRVAMKGLALQDASGMVAFYSFDDGTSATWSALNNRWEGTSGNPNWFWGQVQDYTLGYENDAYRFWRNAATLVGQNTVMQTASTDAPVQYSAVDSNGDGIPDSWYIQFGFDPTGPSIAYQDNDGDGLSNMQEYLMGYNPHLKDSDNNGVPDGEEDFDGDGLTNLHEQNVSGTRADIVDTDDDGYTDWEETTGERLLAGWAPGLDVNSFVDPAPGLVSTSNPLNALDPIERKSLLLDGTGHVVLQDQARHSLRSWTVQGWIRPTLASDGGVIVSRRVYSAYRGNYGINYELGLEPDGLGNLRLYARYVGVQQGGATTEVRINGTGPTEVIGGQNISNLVRREEWTHVAATYDAPNRTFRLYVDGAEATRRSDATEPVGLDMDGQVPFPAQVTIGGGHEIAGVVQNGFEGNLDDVMIIGGAAVAEEVLASANRANTFSAAINSGISGTAAGPGELPTVQQILQSAHIPNQVVIRFAESVTPAQVRDGLAAQLGLTEKRAFDLVPVWVMTIADGTSLADKLTALRAHPLVTYAEPNLILRKSSAPNDTLFGSLWGMENTGQTGGTADADIDATTAWSVTTGDIRVRVAVIDSGIDYNHPDLASNMWPGRGYDFYEDLGDPADPADDDLMDDDPMDDDGHGTHVAGTIGALGNNNLGVVGVNWRTELMAIRFLGPLGGSTEGAVASIEYAVKNGARISNNSWGGNFWSSAIYDAVAAAGRAGHLFIAAAGNDGLDADLNMVTPSSFNLPNMIVVAASDHNDQPAVFSNFGSQNVHLAAPGVDILSTWLDAQYNVISGTSMASPHVTGVAALILAQNPQLSIDAVKNLILSSVDSVEGWEDLVSTGGRLNAGRALAGRGVTVAYFNFNDGGETVQDFTIDRDWENEWAHAGTFFGGASFDATQKYDEKLDSNSDGIPDWWSEAYGFDPMGPSIADVDSDGDGITNVYEYLAGTNPLKTDSFGDGIADGNRDLNGDGLTLSQEQQVGIHPILVDTDDDGVSDQQEIANGTNPLDSYDQQAANAVSFAGNGRLRIRSERDIDVMSNWTVEAWVNPASNTTSGIITRRIELFPVNGARWIDYELGLDNGVPYVRYAYRGQGAPVTVTVVPEAGALPTGTLVGGEWTHLAGVLDSSNHQLRLFVNGKRVGYQLPIVRPPMSVIGVFESTIGGGDLVGGVVANAFTGQIDAVRIWNYARNGFQIQDERGTLQPEFSNGTPDSNRAPVRLFNFDGTGTYAHNDRHSRDWLLDWMHAAEFQGDATRVAAVFPPLNLDYDDDDLSDVDERLAGWLEKRSESPYIHRALSFDGTGVVEVDELVDSVDTRLYGHETWTIETWVRPSAVPATQVSLVRRSGLNNGLSSFDLGLIPVAGEVKPYIRFNRADNSNDFVTLQGALSLPVGVGPDNWTHLAAVYANGRLSLYMDGVLQGTSTHTAIVPWTNGRSKLYLGALGFEGDIHETRIWNLERSATEIADNMRKVMLFNSSLLQNNFDATQGTYPGRSTTDNEDGYVVDLSFPSATPDGFAYLEGTQTHRFTVAAWVKMEPGAAGGVIAARAIDLAVNGSGIQDYRYNHVIAINNEGCPVGAWEGQVTQLTSTTTPGANGAPPTVTWASAQEVITRDVISNVDIRDGSWHHIALVGDAENVRLYIDGIMDREVPYYVFRALPSGFESFFRTYEPIDSVLRSADEMSGGRLQNVADGFGGLIDEVVYYNVPLNVEELVQVKDFGLTRSEIRTGRLPISPVPEFTLDDGLPHVALVSYLTFDGDLEMPFVPDLANEDQDYRVLPLPTTGLTEIVANSTPPVSVDRLRVFFDKMTGYFAAVDDGFTVENYMYRNDYGFAGLRLGGVDVIELDASQVIHIDTDLNNDGLPDWWYVHNGLDPSGPSAAHDDWDGDGLTNYQEFLAGTNPKLFDTLGTTGLSDYDQIVSGGGLTNGEVFDDGDDVPYGWELANSGYPEIFDAYSDMDSDGWNALQEFLAGTDPTDSSDVPRPVVNVRVDWANAVAGTPIRWEAWDHAEMDGPSIARGTVSPGVGSGLLVQDVDANGVPVGAFTYGANYILFYADLDASGTWNNDANGFPEPAGFPDVNPVHMGSGDISGVRVGLSVEPNGYRRFHWPPVPGRNSYTVRVRRNTSSGMVMFFDRVIEGRTYVHEYDFKLGSPSKTDKNAYPNMPFELPNGTSEFPGFELYVNTDPANSTTMVAQVQPGGATLWGKDWRTALSKPTLVAPLGSLSTAGTEFKWRQTTGVPTRFTLEIRPGSPTAPQIYSKTIAVTPDSPDGTYSLTPDLFPGQGTFAHGLYFWRIVSQRPGINGLVSSSSDYSSFMVDTTSTGTGPYDISGTLWYMGRATPTNVIVQAYRSSALLGSPTQQVTISGAGDWRLSGLPVGTYYLLAFMDVNGNGTRENWEPMGLLKSPTPYAENYTLKAVTVGPNSSGHRIIVRDLDTDNDNFSDAWEMQTNGNLTTTNSTNTLTVYPPHSTESGSAIPDMIPLNLALDSDGDGVSDAMEMLLGTNPSVAGDFPAAQVEDELIATGDGVSVAFAGVLSNSPVVPGSVVVNGNSFQLTDNGLGVLSGPGLAGTINYATGAWTLNLGAVVPALGEPITADYQHRIQDLLVIDGFNQSWLGFNLNTTLFNLARKIGVVVQYSTDMVTWYDVPGTRVDVGPGGQDWFTTPGGNVGPGPIFYRLRWFPIAP